MNTIVTLIIIIGYGLFSFATGLWIGKQIGFNNHKYSLKRKKGASDINNNTHNESTRAQF